MHFSLVSLSTFRVLLTWDCLLRLFFALFTCSLLIYVQSLSQIKNRCAYNSEVVLCQPTSFQLDGFSA